MSDQTTTPEAEDHARTLLLAAAETIDVPPGLGVPQSTGRRWALPAIAAGVVLVLGVGVGVVAHQLRVPVNVEPMPLEVPGHTVGGVVPQTGLMTPDQARTTLTDAGYTVRLVDSSKLGCRPLLGRVFETRPMAGSAVEPGSTVTVRVAVPGPTDDCIIQENRPEAVAAALLDRLRFGARAQTEEKWLRYRVEFAPEVQVYVDGDLAGIVLGDETTSLPPEQWPDAAVAAFLRSLERGVVSVGEDDGDDFACGDTDPPRALQGRPSIVVSSGDPRPSDFIAAGCSWLRIYRDARGRIDALAWTPWPE
ncbi:PASTA domain-containing protein [Nocardioides acrostichi]|uniref:PASTA domain-containing protein n=1 Tax=Nocardioides acrostichi TaxID=2784339 RepID=A0A930Y6T0_9ACTN|nr:PASTA domain-containing protein [Nocardioides acrostichi]MBF4161271.1 PASTA domain-containing protein [Nocardioides acrostichi]